ncbi:hypothetical protein F4553_003021 [Allocatelliglobosispora scoriae]|uniref:DUF2795 domain-containing protein n=1 Tax=Allocatelliglobosispora scoriae TaxID=643052 RepID=A0A841BSD8_9ACTN|nr:DUF2795 domain-containing protein [Allocatelliglobosispora scoriae]MBB5869642.1 hypothetical protein [Allocatelliglobosispora scoriae]
MLTVTRTEVADHVLAAFQVGPASRGDVLAAATATHARPQVLSMLQSLPERSYGNLRDLWYELPDMPMGSM